MIPIRTWTRLAVLFVWTAVGSSHIAIAPTTSYVAPNKTAKQDRIVFSHTLPPLDGAHLEATVLEVTYGPGESSPPHSHPCPVVGYVIQGALRSQVNGEAGAVYKAGQSFYEAPNGVHIISANASSNVPVKFLAYFICDHDTRLTVPPPETPTPGGKKP
jgi:quercetin dioxygenase-like cupin family protein